MPKHIIMPCGRPLAKFVREELIKTGQCLVPKSLTKQSTIAYMAWCHRANTSQECTYRLTPKGYLITASGNPVTHVSKPVRRSASDLLWPLLRELAPDGVVSISIPDGYSKASIRVSVNRYNNLHGTNHSVAITGSHLVVGCRNAVPPITKARKGISKAMREKLREGGIGSVIEFDAATVDYVALRIFCSRETAKSVMYRYRTSKRNGSLKVHIEPKQGVADIEHVMAMFMELSPDQRKMFLEVANKKGLE